MLRVGLDTDCCNRCGESNPDRLPTVLRTRAGLSPPCVSIHAAAAILFTIAFLLLSACSSSAGWTPPPPPGPWQTVVSQPATVPVYDNRSPPRGTVGVTRWHMQPRPGDVVSADGVLGISIDSAASLQPGKSTIVLGTNLAAPIPAAGKAFRYSFDLRVTRAERTGNAVAHAVAYYSFCSRSSGACRWHGLIAYDSRCGRSGTVEKPDTGGTERPIINVVDPGYRCTPHDWRPVSFSPSIPLSADEELRGIVCNPETWTAPGEAARIDVQVRNWRLEMQ